MLMETKLDDDVANLELDLYLVSRTVKSNVSYRGLVHLNAEEVIKLSFSFQFYVIVKFKNVS